jgi:hypothetical protein
MFGSNEEETDPSADEPEDELAGDGEGRERDPEQKYEYKTISNSPESSEENQTPDAKINRQAAQGWVYIDRFQTDGTTTQLLFRREL